MRNGCVPQEAGTLDAREVRAWSRSLAYRRNMATCRERTDHLTHLGGSNLLAQDLRNRHLVCVCDAFLYALLLHILRIRSLIVFQLFPIDGSVWAYSPFLYGGFPATER